MGFKLLLKDKIKNGGIHFPDGQDWIAYIAMLKK